MRLLFAILLLLSITVAQAADQPQPRTKKITVKKVAVQVKIHLPRSLRSAVQLEVSDDDSDDGNMDLQIAYRRPDLVDNSELPLSDYVTLRLAHARRLALAKYQEIWG